MAKLTEKSLATAVTLNSLIHIVNTGDTTQSAYGSSYKAELSQLVPLFGSNPDVTITGGTYNPSTGVVTFYNNTGGTFNVSGFITGFTDTFVSGGTYTAGTATFTNTTGGTFNVNGFYTGSSEFYVSDGSLTSNRIVNTDGYALAFSGGASNLYFAFIGTGDKNIQWSQTGSLNWNLINGSSTNDLQIERYSSGGSYLDTPLSIEFSSGNVGVGITSPTAKLHINNTTTGNTFLAEDSTNPDSSPFVINNSGNVGIGISGTTYKLDVNGTTIHRDNVLIENGKEIYWSNTSATWPTSTNSRIRWTLNNDTAQIYAFQPEADNNDFVFKITDNTDGADNFVYWLDDYRGESFDQYPLEMNGPSFFVNAVRRYALSAATSGAGTTNFYVLKSGATSSTSSILHANVSTSRVGVNTSSPTETLDVNGKTKTTSLQITSGATNGYVLTSDASGNTSWQSGATVNIYNSDDSLTGNRTVSQGSFDLNLNGDENSKFQAIYTSTINPLDSSQFYTDVSSTNISHYDDTNGVFFSASLFPGNSSMNVGVISTNETGGINFNTTDANLTYYDGVATTRQVSVDISGVAINQVYYFPNTDGTNGQVLTTDGSGNTSWQNISGGCNCSSFSAITLTANTVFSERIKGKLGPLLVNDTDLGNVYFGSTSGVTIDVPNGRIGINSPTPTYDLEVSGTTSTTNLRITSGATNGYVLTSDASGNGTWQASSGGVSIDPFNNIGSTGTSFTWNVSGLSTNFQATLTANTTLNLTNVRNGDYGTLIVTQDAVGSRTITFGTVNGAGTTHRVTNGGGGSPVLTSNANAIDILTFTYNGSTMFWTVGNDYT